MSNDGGELCSARCAEQPFDVAFHPGNNGIFVSGLITGAVSTRRRLLSPRCSAFSPPTATPTQH